MSKPYNPNSKNIVCLCRGGCSRSVGLSNTLKYGNGHNSVPIGFEGNSVELQNLLFEWAEIILVVREEFREKVPERYRDKVRHIELGKDVYFNPNPDLYNKCAEWVATQPDLRLDVLKYLSDV